jgi:glycosyltransferase involved in cell wall biosynthesis
VTPERLRVVQVLEAVVGGTRKHVMDLCTRLDPARFELHALISPLRDPSPEVTCAALRAAGVRVVPVPMRRRPDPLSDLACLGQITRYLAEVRPQVVHCHSSKAGVLGRLAAARAGVAGAVYTAHGFAFSMRVSPLSRAVYLAAERRLGRLTSRLVAVCGGEREVALQAGLVAPGQCVLIPNGVEASPVDRVDRAAKLAALGLADDSRVVLCVGDLRAQKGHRYAVAALADLAQTDPRAHLVVAGEGPLRAGLEAQGRRVAPGRVHLAGLRDDIAQWQACCDVFCQPSLWEGCPYALLEAGAAGCGLVVSDVCGNRDLVGRSEAGWLVPAGDARALAAALREALDAPDERARRGALARERVQAQYSLEQMVRLTAGLYEEVAGLA